MTIRRSAVVSTGSYLPERRITNHELADRLDTSDAWIRERTGITQRHVAAEGETTSDLACHAARRALVHGGLEAADIDCIVVATATPDYTFPATATQVQAMLGMTHGFALDVHAVCTGFVYGLAVADNFIRLGQADRVLLIGAETFSRILDWDDRSTCVLFGDGAGAVVLEAVTGNSGVLSTHLHSDGRYRDMLHVDGGPSATRHVGHLRMNGREVFRHATRKLTEVVEEALLANGIEASSVDWLGPHQANRRIIDATARKLGLASDRIVVTIDRHANTSAASIPLALAEATADGRISPGDLVLIEAMGGGFTWGAALIRWSAACRGGDSATGETVR
ncbi:MAG: ketoacyl-ACP synthase III [bacterium]|nr:ketoacyl-ACP synthase III [bacterium]